MILIDDEIINPTPAMKFCSAADLQPSPTPAAAFASNGGDFY